MGNQPTKSNKSTQAQASTQASSSTQSHTSTQANDTTSSSISHLDSDSPLDSDRVVLQDPQLTIICERTTSAINSIANSPSLSFDFLNHVTSSLADINELVVSFILQSKEAIWENRDLYDLVEEYFANSSKTLAFYLELKECLNKIIKRQTFIELALIRFEEENSKPGTDKQFPKTVKELDNFKSGKDPFTGDFRKIFWSIGQHQKAMLSKLQARRKRLEGYKKVSKVLIGAAAAVMVICFAVAPVAAGRVTASLVPLGAVVGKLMKSMWEEYNKGIHYDKLDLVKHMENESLKAVVEHRNLEALVEKWSMGSGMMLFNAEIAVEREDEGAVTFAINKIKEGLEELRKTVNDLEKNLNRLIEDINGGRSVTLNKIANYGSVCHKN